MLNRLGETPPTNQQSTLSRYRNDPVGFARDILGVEPWAKQCEILEALAREPRVTVRSCNGAGKTICAAWAVLWFLFTRPGSIVVSTAPTGHQVKNLLWRRIRAAFQASKVPLPGRCQTQQLDCAPDWYAIGIATDEEVHFQGPHSSAGVLMVGDEASGLAPWLYQAMSGSLTEAGGKLLLIGNPNSASGAFYDSHLSWPAAQKFHISAFDVPEHILRPGWREDVARDFGEESPIYQVRVLGEFPPQGEDSLISLDWVRAAQKRSLAAEGDLELGVDISRYGSDESVAYLRQGPVVLGGDYWRGQDTMVSAGRIARLCRRHSPDCVKVDEIGIGAGVVDRLAEEGFPVVGVNVGESAWDSEHFANRRSEIFWGLRERFREGDIVIPADDTLLVAQLVALKFSYTPRGQIKLQSKEDMRKERTGAREWQSPDRADALSLAFASSEGFQPIVVVGEGRGWGS